MLENNKEEIFANLKDITGKDESFLQIYSGYSEEFDYYSEEKNYMKKTRFIHIDGCHVGESVYNDLIEIANNGGTNDFYRYLGVRK